VVLGHVVAKETGLIEGFDLQEAILIELVERDPGQVLDMVENPEPDPVHRRLLVIAWARL
jgi:hypothetical protein